MSEWSSCFDPALAQRLLEGQVEPPEGPWVDASEVRARTAAPAAVSTDRFDAMKPRDFLLALVRAGALKGTARRSEDWASESCSTLKAIIEHGRFAREAVIALPLVEVGYATDWGLRNGTDLSAFVARVPDGHPDLEVVLAYWVRLLVGGAHPGVRWLNTAETSTWEERWWAERDQRFVREQRVALAGAVAKTLGRARDEFALMLQQRGWLEDAVIGPVRDSRPWQIEDNVQTIGILTMTAHDRGLERARAQGVPALLDWWSGRGAFRASTSIVQIAGLSPAQHADPHTSRVWRAARDVLPGQVASLVLADPARWWRLVARALGEYDEAVQADLDADVAYALESGSTEGQARADVADQPQPVAVASMHHALAEMIQPLVRLALAGRVVEADQVWFQGDPFVVSGSLMERLVWLLENAEGPGFEAVLGVLADHPEPMLRRRVAKHSQTPQPLWASMFSDEDRWVRVGATDRLARVFGAAVPLDGA